MSRCGIPPVLVAVALVACSTRSDDQASRTDSAADTTTQASAGATSGAAPRIVSVVATDYAFDAPAELPAGLTTFEMTNQGKQLHHVQLVRLDSGKTAQDYVKALKPNTPPPRWSVLVGGPNAANPGGGTSNATVSLEPGNYAVVCFVDLPDRVPHFAKGMVRDLKVTPASGPTVAPPTADVTLALTDYEFGLPQSIAPGRHTIRVTNSAQQPHEIQLVRLAPGKTMRDLMTWLEKMQGPPPGDAIGGVDALANGREAYFTADLQPGNYVAICFLPDAKDGKPHFVHGMIKEFTIGAASAN
jgi:hypothetical protein